MKTDISPGCAVCTVNFVLVVTLTHCSSYLAAPDDQAVPHNPANANASQGADGEYRGVEK